MWATHKDVDLTCETARVPEAHRALAAAVYSGTGACGHIMRVLWARAPTVNGIFFSSGGLTSLLEVEYVRAEVCVC